MLHSVTRLILVISVLSLVLAINPPQTGKFPKNILQNFENQGIGFNYGDEGWINKIAELKSGNYRDAQAEFNLPVLLGRYSDTGNTYFSANDFQNLLFDNNSTGSMKEYYYEVSYGNFLVDGATQGWYQSTYSMSEAVDNTKQFVAQIAALADPDFNYAEYDNDGLDNIPNSGDDDGYVDGLIVVYAGCGPDWGEGNDNIWPHMSNLGSNEYVTDDVGVNGNNIIISAYAVNPELAGGGDCNTSVIRPIGVYAHEFGHILGLPDLYDRDDSDGSSAGLGEWCLMASGSWLGWAGDTPSHMSTWCKIQMGWIEPTTLTEGQTGLEILQVETEAFALKVWEDDYNWSRYFLIENRQAVGFDSYIHGVGLLIYHIDENQGYGSNRWSSGTVNDNELHKMVDLEEADGFDHLDFLENRGDSGDPYPGSSGNLTFDDSSYPNSNRYNGDESKVSVTNISVLDAVITADIDIRPQSGYAIVYDEMGISGWGFGYQEPQDSYGGVLFTPSVSGYLTEIDVGMRADSTSFQILIYDSFNSLTPGNLLLTKDTLADRRGWHSIEVDSIAIAADTDYFVAVKINAAYAISYDNTGALSGRSFFSGDGINYNDNISNNGDINIRSKISYGSQALTMNDDLNIANQFILYSSYPNPFNPTTQVRYYLPNVSNVQISIYDLVGREIRTLINREQNSGFKTLQWNAMDNLGQPVSAGMYIYTIQAGEFRKTRKMVLLK